MNKVVTRGLGNPQKQLQKALLFSLQALRALGASTKGETARLGSLLRNIIGNNSLWLYPRAEQGGPWPKKGAGNMNSMTEDELRYFIEWRLPLYVSEVSDIRNFKPGTKRRVQNRYIAATKGLIQLGKYIFTQRFGCYEYSGLYAGIGNAGSNTIKHYNQNCTSLSPGSGENAGGGFPGNGSGTSPGDGSGTAPGDGSGTPPGNNNNSPNTPPAPNKAGMGSTKNIMLFVGIAAAGYAISQSINTGSPKKSPSNSKAKLGKPAAPKTIIV